MENKRRAFVKKALTTSALVVASGATAVIASDKRIGEASSNGVVVGKSNKKEI